MTYVRLNHVDADDERWIDAGADAFAVHFAAMVWCDRHLKDGRISSGMAHRVSLAVPAERVGPAIAALLEYGFWRADDGDFPHRGLPRARLPRGPGEEHAGSLEA